MSWLRKSGIAYGWKIPANIDIPEEIQKSENWIIIENGSNKASLFAIGCLEVSEFPCMIELYNFFKQFDGNEKERQARALYLKYFDDTSPSLYLYTRID